VKFGRSEDPYLDVLRDIEIPIMEIYQEHPDLVDSMVDVALEGLVRVYTAEQKGRAAPRLSLPERSQQVFDAVKSVCEWRLGRQELVAEDDTDEKDVSSGFVKTIDEIIMCLKHIRKSIKLWTTEYGRRGYLDYVNQFFPF
jgi:hypothetical protein